LMEIYENTDFFMACGDDWTDEDTFKVLPETAFTIKVGGSESQAKYSVNSYKEIRGLLNKLTES
jgi:trehalose 6-phosphate synthase/phosphatase